MPAGLGTLYDHKNHIADNTGCDRDATLGIAPVYLMPRQHRFSCCLIYPLHQRYGTYQPAANTVQAIIKQARHSRTKVDPTRCYRNCSAASISLAGSIGFV